MIQTYTHQKELHEARLDTNTLERLFAPLIADGTNCSPFESDIIVEKAKEVLLSAIASKTISKEIAFDIFS